MIEKTVWRQPRRPLSQAALAAVCFVLLWGGGAEAASRYPVRAENGMVVSAHRAASEAGIAMLEKGGNAVDAAVAAALTIGVVEPYSSGLGGGGFMLIYRAKTGAADAIDYREVAPRAAYRDMYLDSEGRVIKDASLVGYKAVAVPGTVAGLVYASKTYGRLPFKVVARPAIRWASRGFRADEAFVSRAAARHALLRRFPETARVFLRADGKPFALGDLVVQKDLAGTLRLIARKGAAGFYQGRVARAISVEMAAHGGLVTAEDLSRYAPRMRRPVRGTYRGREIISMPPPSSGGIHLIEMLNMLEPFDLGAMGFGSSDTIHIMAEVMRRAYADRAEFLGDPAFADIPVKGLLSKTYARSLAMGIDMETAGKSANVGHGDPRAFAESGNTTHISVVDKDRNAVSLTQTINAVFGSGVVVGGTGVLLNDEMDDFSAKPGVPNLYGLVGSEANAIAPGKIPLSSMTPTIVLREGRPSLVVGSKGGSRIITAVVQIIVNVIDHGMNVREAVDMPKIHHQWLPDAIRLEPFAAPRDVVEALRAKGHAVQEGETYGNAMAIVIDDTTGELFGAADARGVGAAVGY